VSFSIQAKNSTLPDVLELLQRVLREPRLPQDEFEVMKRERLAQLERMKTEPAMLAPRLLQRELNPYAKEDVRYEPTVDESIERLKAVTYEQVSTLYHEFVAAQAGELTIVGDFDPAACLAILKQTLDGWSTAKPYARIPMPILSGVGPSEHTINTPDKANATFIAGLLFALRDDDPDYPAMLMANYILGGGTLSSRLGTRVRQKEGLSYGITSSLGVSSHDQRAAFTISAIVAPQNLSRLQVCVREELDRLLRDGVTSEELDKARDGYLQALKVGRSSDSALVASLGRLRYADRTMLWEADLEKRIAALTPEQISAALQRHLDPNQLVLVWAGDFAAKETTQTSQKP
jgi:zinc protease